MNYEDWYKFVTEAFGFDFDPYPAYWPKLPKEIIEKTVFAINNTIEFMNEEIIDFYHEDIKKEFILASYLSFSFSPFRKIFH